MMRRKTFETISSFQTRWYQLMRCRKRCSFGILEDARSDADRRGWSVDIWDLILYKPLGPQSSSDSSMKSLSS